MRMINKLIKIMQTVKDEKANEKKIIENIQTFSKQQYSSFFTKILTNIINKEEQVTQDFEKVIQKNVKDIEEQKNELKKSIKAEYTNSQSKEILANLEKLLKLLKEFIDNTFKDLKDKITFEDFLKKNNLISKDNKNIKLNYETKKCSYEFNFKEEDDSDFKINYKDDSVYNKINNLAYKTVQINDNNLALYVILKGFEKIIHTYKEDVKTFNDKSSKMANILKDNFFEKCQTAQKQYGSFLKNIKEKDYEDYLKTNTSKTKKTRQEYTEDELTNYIKKYLGVSENGSNNNITEILKDIPTAEINNYKSGGQNKKIEEVIIFIKTFLEDIYGKDIASCLGLSSTDYNFESLETNEGLLMTESLCENRIKFINENKQIKKVEFYTSEKSIYMDKDGEYITKDNDDNKFLICQNAARNYYGYFEKGSIYEALEAQIKEIKERNVEDANSFFDNTYEKNKELFDKIDTYYSNYKSQVDKVLKENVEAKKEEYKKDETKRDKIAETIKNSMKKYLLTDIPETYLNKKGLDWCQETTIKGYIEGKLDE